MTDREKQLKESFKDLEENDPEVFNLAMELKDTTEALYKTLREREAFTTGLRIALDNNSMRDIMTLKIVVALLDQGIRSKKLDIKKWLNEQQ